MTHFAAVPFTLKRSSDLLEADAFTTTTETAHGLVRLEEGRLVFQWRVALETESMSSTSIETTREIEPVRELVIPLADVGGAAVRQRWWQVLTGPRLVITAADLLAFEKIAGQEGLKLDHPAKLELRLRRADRLAAEEFAAEVSLALAQLPRTPEVESAEREDLPGAPSRRLEGEVEDEAGA